MSLLTTRALGPSSAFGSMSKTTIQFFGLSAVAGSSGARRVHTPASSALRSGRPRCRCQLSHGNGQGQNASGADLRGSNPELQHHLVERPLEDVGDIRPFDSVPQPLGSARSPQLCLVASVGNWVAPAVIHTDCDGVPQLRMPSSVEPHTMSARIKGYWPMRRASPAGVDQLGTPAERWREGGCGAGNRIGTVPMKGKVAAKSSPTQRK